MILDSGFVGGTSDYYTGDIGHSLRFRASAIGNLTRTPSVASNQKTMTFAFNCKRGTLGSQQALFWCGISGSDYALIDFLSNDTLRITLVAGGSSTGLIASSEVFRDPQEHIQVVAVIDTTNATSTERLQLYARGRRLEVTGNYPTLNTDTYFNTTNLHRIGAYIGLAIPFDGYLSRVCLVVGQVLTPSSFGYLNTEINKWVTKTQAEVKAVVDAGGANSFMLDFDNGTSLTTLGNDKSSKGNNWTLNNFSLTDWMLDVPGNSYCTLNPLALNPSIAASTLTNGNLTASASAANTVRKGTFRITTGKWHACAELTTQPQLFGLGEEYVNTFGSNSSATGARTYWLYNTGTLYTILPGADTSVAAQVASGGHLVFAVDMDARKLWLGYIPSGGSTVTWIGGGDPESGTSPTATIASDVSSLFPVAGTNGAPIHCNFGQRPFAYTPPTGFKSLCQANLPTPAILNPKKHFDVLTWAGDGTSPKTVGGLLFQPDFVWDKMRSGSYQHALVNSVTGGNRVLHSNSTTAEDVNWAYGYVQSFNADGFTAVAGSTSIENWNLNGSSFVAWCHKAGGAPVTNNAGSIQSQVSANVEAGFSIVTFNGTEAVGTVGHGLSKPPDLIELKDRDGVTDWRVYHSMLNGGVNPANYVLKLNATNAQAADSTIWNNTVPTSSVFSIGANVEVNKSGHKIVAFCYHSVPGFSKFGEWQNNNSTDGTYVDCGFKPRYIMLKNYDNVERWFVLDSARQQYNAMPPTASWLVPNSANAEGVEGANTATIHLLGQGFKILTTNPAAGEISYGTRKYIYAAFADIAGKFS